MRPKGGGINLTITDNAVIGDEFEENPVPAAKMGRRIADNEGFDIRYFHKSPTYLKDDDVP